MMVSRSWFLVLFIALVLATVSAKPKKKSASRRFDRHVNEHKVSKESILANRQQRKKQLEMMILDARTKLADHSAGKNKLTSEEKADLEKRIDMFQLKVNDLAKDLDQREWDNILRREHRHAERRRQNREHVEL